jgi:hypothetical protein
MLGWSSIDAISASRRERTCTMEACAVSGSARFKTHARASPILRATNTSPIPPWPSFLRIS